MAIDFTYNGKEYPTLVELAKALPINSAKLVQWTEDADRFAAEAGSLCYESEPKLGIVNHCRDSGHNTVLEHNLFSFVKKVPIFVARQDMRARHATYDERSLRYVRLKDGGFEYYIPPELKKPGMEEELNLWIYQHEKAFELYGRLTDEEIMENEKARAILPLGIATMYTDSRNAVSWRHHAMKRLCLRAQEEIRLLYRSITQQLAEKAPRLFGDLNMPCYMKQGCGEAKTCGLIPLDPKTMRAVAYEKKSQRKLTKIKLNPESL